MKLSTRASAWLVAPALVAGIALLGQGLPGLGDDPEPVPTGSTSAREAIPPSDLPKVLDDRARAGFRTSNGTLGEPSVQVVDEYGQPLKPENYDDASSAEVNYNDGTHSLRLALGYSQAETEGDADSSCRDGVDDGYYLTCEASTTDESTVIVKVIALLPPEEDYIRAALMVATPEQLRTHEGPVWYRQSVQVISKQTRQVVSASEMVQAADLDSALKSMSNEVDSLTALASDSALVMGEPQ